MVSQYTRMSQPHRPPRAARGGFAKSRPSLYTAAMRRMGIDLGTVRTGLALAEAGVRVATPLCTVAHESLAEALAEVAAHAQRERVDELVVGLPLDLSGREGDAARKARRFAAQLEKRTGLPVRLWDERLSTAAADRSLRSQGVRASARRRMVDQVAATLLLQSYLEAQDAQDMSADPAESPEPH